MYVKPSFPDLLIYSFLKITLLNSSELLSPNPVVMTLVLMEVASSPTLLPLKTCRVRLGVVSLLLLSLTESLNKPFHLSRVWSVPCIFSRLCFLFSLIHCNYNPLAPNIFCLSYLPKSLSLFASPSSFWSNVPVFSLCVFIILSSPLF